MTMKHNLRSRFISPHPVWLIGILMAAYSRRRPVSNAGDRKQP